MTEGFAQILRALEEELHRPETRRDAARLGMLLHPDFEEIGRSGRHYTREDTIRELSAERNLTTLRAVDFVVSRIGDGIALVTYRSANVDAAGNESRVTQRSSLWIETAAGWQMRFHQGTPVARET
jgi:hypothetical protein